MRGRRCGAARRASWVPWALFAAYAGAVFAAARTEGCLAWTVKASEQRALARTLGECEPAVWFPAAGSTRAPPPGAEEQGADQGQQGEAR